MSEKIGQTTNLPDYLPRLILIRPHTLKGAAPGIGSPMGCAGSDGGRLMGISGLPGVGGISIGRGVSGISGFGGVTGTLIGTLTGISIGAGEAGV